MALGFVVVAFIAGCATTQRPLQDSDAIVAQLRNQDLVLVYSGVSNFDAFSVNGEQYQVGAGGTLHLYVYNNENRAALDASKVSPGILSDAHVYRLDNVVAVFIGDDAGAQAAISSVLGAPMF